MSYPAILSTLPAFSPASRRHSAEAHPSQLLEWLRLAARQVFGTELAERIEPYRACSRCVSQVKWCGEGVPRPEQRSQRRHGSPDLWQLGITPLTPSLILGAKADPYSPAEAVQKRTRALLEQLALGPRRSARRTRGEALGTPQPIRATAETSVPRNQEVNQGINQGINQEANQEITQEITGLEISILTRSPLLLRDLDLLAELDQRHAVTVGVLIPAADPRLARRLEHLGPSNPPASPDERFELVHALAAHGIAAEVICTPIRPGLNNSVTVLRGLLGRAHQAGAFDVRPAPLHPAIRPTPAESQQLLALFHRLRLERGFPRILPARG
jgi:hypothetical protein